MTDAEMVMEAVTPSGQGGRADGGSGRGRGMKRYCTIVSDPPWRQPMIGKWARHPAAPTLPYATMTLQEIAALPVSSFAAEGAHLWLWTTNAFLEPAFGVLRAWGFTYLTTITWVKPSGAGAYFASTTQHCLFGYFGKCIFPLARWQPTDFKASVRRHSQKPEQFYDLVERVSPAPRLEMFARRRRLGWDAFGDETAANVQVMA
jgi:N6-adenosine-specific RNA methylase IME4